MGELTKEETRALTYFRDGSAIGPAVGWNADVELAIGDGQPFDGADLKSLFSKGLIDATLIPPPHVEHFDPDSGSIVNDHEWVITPAGRAAIRNHEASE